MRLKMPSLGSIRLACFRKTFVVVAATAAAWSVGDLAAHAASPSAPRRGAAFVRRGQRVPLTHYFQSGSDKRYRVTINGDGKGRLEILVYVHDHNRLIAELRGPGTDKTFEYTVVVPDTSYIEVVNRGDQPEEFRWTAQRLN